MTPADLERKTANLDALRVKWSRTVLDTVESKLADAKAHAEAAVAEAAETGRKTRTTKPFQRALARLDGLLAWLAGDSAESLEGRIRDAREVFYRRAFRLHTPLIPAELHVTPDPEPTDLNLRLVRGALIHGMDLRQELARPFEDARRKLVPAVASGRVDTWHAQALRAVTAAVLRALSDSLEFADSEAGVDLIHPDYLETSDSDLPPAP